MCVCMRVCACVCVRMCVCAGTTKHSRDRYSTAKSLFHHKFYELCGPWTTGNCSFALEHNTDMLRSAACIEKVTREVNGNTVELYAR